MVCVDHGKWVYDRFTSNLERRAMDLALDLGILDALAEKPATQEQLRTRLKLGARATDVIITVLAALALVQRGEETVELTELARTFLLKGARHDLRPILHQRCTSDWLTMARQDRPMEPSRVQAWESGKAVPDFEASTARMHALTCAAGETLARNASLHGVSSLLDVAGGSGGLTMALAAARPEMQLGLFELPDVAGVARTYFERSGWGDRIRIHAGNMFADPLPQGYHSVLMSNVLHDWSDEQCVELLRTCHACLPPGGRVLLHEMLLDKGKDGPLTVALFSLMMLMSTRGRQFTAGELIGMLQCSGFTDARVTPAWGYFSVVMAVKA